ncbi:MAG: 2-phospho-L-lactate transferase [Paracoccaceae bacterium]|nr:2-phospho-L-lactate transferase [Paracoccaceae bacterium]
MNFRPLKVALLAGGVGGAKLAEGLAAVHEIELSIIGNIGDDDIFHGLTVSPDIDTLCYSLSSMVNRSQGWGVANDDFKALSLLKKLGSDTWMLLGDTDFGLHIYRSNRLRAGDRPSEILNDITNALDIKAKVVLPTDDQIKTKIKTDSGWLSFQEYFVKERCLPKVLDIRYEGASSSKPTNEVINQLENADLIVIAPSNPLLSIAPILAVPIIKELLLLSKAPIIAVSPVIAGKAVKGPAGTIMESLNMRVDSHGVANFYKEFLDVILIDNQDKHLKAEIEILGLSVKLENILMNTQREKMVLASKVIEIGKEAISKGIRNG